MAAASVALLGRRASAGFVASRELNRQAIAQLASQRSTGSWDTSSLSLAETSWIHADGCSSSCLPFLSRPTETSWIHADGCSSSCLPFLSRPTSARTRGFSSIDLADSPQSTSASEHTDTAEQLAPDCLTDGESESEADETEDSHSQLPFTYCCTNSIVGMPLARVHTNSGVGMSSPPLMPAMLLHQMHANQAGLVSGESASAFGMDSATDATGMSMPPWMYGQTFGTPFAVVPVAMPPVMPTSADESKPNQHGYGNQADSRHADKAAPAQHRRKRTCEANAKSRAGVHQKDSPTTICFRNLPNNYSTQMVLELLNENGFGNRYDFVYVPHDFKRLPSLVNVGYFFVNFVSHAVAVSAMEKFVGFRRWAVLSTKVLAGSWAERTQGKAACIERCKYFTFMHNEIPNECKPMMFERGVATRVGELSN